MKEDQHLNEFVSEAQARRLWAIAYEWAREHDFSKADVHDRVIALCKRHGADGPGGLTRREYNIVCGEFDE